MSGARAFGMAAHGEAPTLMVGNPLDASHEAVKRWTRDKSYEKSSKRFFVERLDTVDEEDTIYVTKLARRVIPMTGTLKIDIFRKELGDPWGIVFWWQEGSDLYVVDLMPGTPVEEFNGLGQEWLEPGDKIVSVYRAREVTWMLNYLRTSTAVEVIAQRQGIEACRSSVCGGAAASWQTPTWDDALEFGQPDTQAYPLGSWQFDMQADTLECWQPQMQADTLECWPSQTWADALEFQWWGP